MHVGAHMSIAGGLHLAFQRSAEIGGNTLQIFSQSPRGRSVNKHTQEAYQIAREWRQTYQQVWGLIHSNYLANLAREYGDPGTGISGILNDFEVAHECWFDAVNVHMGKEKGRASKDEAFSYMVKNLEIILKEVKNKGYKVLFVFENTAGQGSELGSTLEELGYFYQNYLKDLPVKFCIDTAHCRGGGIDVGQRESVCEKFDALIGIENLYSIHLNDSKALLRSHLDRHAPLGRGAIGLPSLAQVIQRAAKNDRHLYIETTEPGLRPEEIQMVHKIAQGDVEWIQSFHKQRYKTQLLKKFEAVGLF